MKVQNNFQHTPPLPSFFHFLFLKRSSGWLLKLDSGWNAVCVLLVQHYSLLSEFQMTHLAMFKIIKGGGLPPSFVFHSHCSQEQTFKEISGQHLRPLNHLISGFNNKLYNIWKCYKVARWMTGNYCNHLHPDPKYIYLSICFIDFFIIYFQISMVTKNHFSYVNIDIALHGEM